MCVCICIYDCVFRYVCVCVCSVGASYFQFLISDFKKSTKIPHALMHDFSLHLLLMEAFSELSCFAPLQNVVILW